jgi:hypothetical protein
MANFCENILELIPGQTPKKRELYELLKPYLGKDPDSREGQKEQRLDFEKILPIPPELTAGARETSPPEEKDPAKDKELLGKFGATNRYDWTLENWGTKSNSVATIFGGHEVLSFTQPDDQGATNVCFHTAWDPPLGIVEALAAQTKRCWRLRYFDILLRDKPRGFPDNQICLTHPIPRWFTLHHRLRASFNQERGRLTPAPRAVTGCPPAKRTCDLCFWIAIPSVSPKPQ